MSLKRSIPLAVAIMFGPAAAFAQLAAPATAPQANLSGVDQTSMFSRDRNISVRERPRTAYEALGVPVGTFTLFPKVELDADYNDNIYATTTGRDADWIFHVQPSAVLQSNWARHSVQLYARASANEFSKFTTENTIDYSVGTNDRLDIKRDSYLGFGGDYGRYTEPRTSAGAQGTVSPVRYDLGEAYLTGQYTLNRLKLSGREGFQDFSYENAAAFGGGTVIENDRDRSVYSTMGRADYALSPDTAAFVQVTGNWRDYRNQASQTGPDRTSSGVEALGGVNFDITALLRGEIGVGYLSQAYNSSAFKTVSGFGARATVEWFPTQLTTVTATASRTVQDAAIPNSSGYLATAVGLQLDHELLRNVILTANGSYERDAYNGVSRNDNLYSAGVSATYLLNRVVGLNLGYSFYKQESSGASAGSPFRINRVHVGLVLQY